MEFKVRLPLYLTWKALKLLLGWPYSRAHTWRMMHEERDEEKNRRGERHQVRISRLHIVENRTKERRERHGTERDDDQSRTEPHADAAPLFRTEDRGHALGVGSHDLVAAWSYYLDRVAVHLARPVLFPVTGSSSSS